MSTYVWILVAISMGGDFGNVTVVERFQSVNACNATLAYISEQRKQSKAFKDQFHYTSFSCLPGDRINPRQQ